jgi:hypothetical protein
MATQSILEGTSSLSEAESTINEAVRTLSAAREKITAEARGDDVPQWFRGKISNYRYTASGHRFELEVGGGLWLFVSTTSQYFDPFLEKLIEGSDDIAPDDNVTGKMLNGRLIEVRRRKRDNVLVPVQPLQLLAEGYFDSYRKFFFRDAEVLSANTNRYRITADSEDPGYVIADRLDGTGDISSSDLSLYAPDLIVVGRYGAGN